MVMRRLLRVMRARWILIGLFVALGAGVALAASAWMSPKYRASSVMVIELKGTDPVLGGAVAMPQTLQGYLVTQTEVLRSERVMQRVIDQLDLLRNDDLLQAAQADAPEESDARRRILRHFDRRIQVDASREGSTLIVSYEGPRAALSAEIVNAFTAAYLQTALELRTGPAGDFTTWFEAQTRDHRDRLEAAQRRLSAAQRASGILADDERLDVETLRLTEISSQWQATQAALAESRARVDASRSGASMPEVVAHPLLQTLSADLGRVEARLRQLGARLGPAHPEVIAEQAQAEQLRTRLAGETARVSASLQASHQVNQARELKLREALEAQRTRVAGLKGARDQLHILEREVQSAQRALEMVSQRLTETRLESQARHSNASVLTSAVAPARPSRPQPVLNAVLGCVLGLGLGLGAALMLESSQRPVRDPDDARIAGGLTVLARLPELGARGSQRLIGP
jgi:succinoglycan biosynthesis transport protein ExoP